EPAVLGQPVGHRARQGLHAAPPIWVIWRARCDRAPSTTRRCSPSRSVLSGRWPGSTVPPATGRRTVTSLPLLLPLWLPLSCRRSVLARRSTWMTSPSAVAASDVAEVAVRPSSGRPIARLRPPTIDNSATRRRTSMLHRDLGRPSGTSARPRADNAGFPQTSALVGGLRWPHDPHHQLGHRLGHQLADPARRRPSRRAGRSARAARRRRPLRDRRRGVEHRRAARAGPQPPARPHRAGRQLRHRERADARAGVARGRAGAPHHRAHHARRRRIRAGGPGPRGPRIPDQGVGRRRPAARGGDGDGRLDVPAPGARGAAGAAAERAVRRAQPARAGRPRAAGPRAHQRRDRPAAPGEPAYGGEPPGQPAQPARPQQPGRAGRRGPPARAAAMTERPSPAGAAATALGFTGVGLLIASTIAELSDLHPRAELTTGAGAGAAFLVAMALSRGGDPQVLDRRGRLLVGAGLAALLAVAALWQITEYAAPRVLLLLIPVALLFSTAGLAVREAAVQRRRAHLRELRARLDGEEAERRRWVRELHDDTLQELAAVMVVLGAANNGQDPHIQAKGIAEARELVGRQIQTLRRLIAQMRPLALDSLGLNAAIEDLAQNAHEATGIDVEVVTEPLPRLPTDTETSLYRVVQEALTNAVRHSGARRITIHTSA